MSKKKIILISLLTITIIIVSSFISFRFISKNETNVNTKTPQQTGEVKEVKKQKKKKLILK